MDGTVSDAVPGLTILSLNLCSSVQSVAHKSLPWRQQETRQRRMWVAGGEH